MADDGVWVDSRLCLAILAALRTSVDPGAVTSAAPASVGDAAGDEALQRLVASAHRCAASAGAAVDAMADDATSVVLAAIAVDRW